MRDIQLYAKDTFGNFQRLELFGGDSVVITDSIRNAKDPAKVFTTFSQQFVIPASKVNNKVFRHYYNYNIDYSASATNAFDARKKIDSYIEINSIPFKVGRLSLEGVDMRDNKPYAYRITFYGSIVDLKDVLGEDKLPSLTSTEYAPNFSLDIDKEYSAQAVKNALTAFDGPTADGTIVPLITANQYLYYDSDQESEQSGNLYYGTVVQGVEFDKLKYAIKITKIIEAIESKYSQISFADTSFFKAADQYDFNQLYMWCHRKKGTKTIEAGPDILVDFADDDTDTYIQILDDTVIPKAASDSQSTAAIIWEFTPATGYENVRYDIVLYKNGERAEVGLNEEVKGISKIQQGLTATIPASPFTSGDEFQVFVRTYEEPIQFSEIQVRYTESFGIGPSHIFYSTDLTDYPIGYKFNIADNMPDMKIIDFLSGLFKMFNLVAYVDANNKIQVQTLDEFYSSDQLDITKYVDIEKSQVNSALPYKEITFGYSDTKTILAQQHYQEIAEVDANGRGPFEWGAVEYSSTDNNLSGGTYKIQPDFHHMKYEKLIDRFNGNDVNIQWGWFVDDNEEEYLGKALVFYSTTFNSGVDFGFLTRDERLKVSGGQAVYYPSNFRLVDDDTSESIHFNPEKSEYTNTVGDSTLFSRYYQKYIENVFDKRTRIIKVSSVLPVNILIQIKLSDVILLNGQKYRINSYKANLITGRTDFELINYYD